MSTGKQPLKEYRCGTVRAAIWRDETEDGGRLVVRHSIKIQKEYRDDKTGNWEQTNYFFVNELPKLARVAQKAFDFVELKESEDPSDAANGR